MLYRYLFALALLCQGSVSHADDAVIGYVKTLSGQARLTFAGKSENAEVGTAVRVGQVIDTGADGSLGITFKDETIVSIGPNTSVAVDEFLYAPAKDQLKLSANLLKGSLQYISGVIAKLRPEAVSLKTPSAIIGVRGTRFLVKVED